MPLKTIIILLAVMGSSALAGKTGEGSMGGLINPVNAVMAVVVLFAAFFILKSFWKMLGCLTWILIFAVLAGGAFFAVNSGGIDINALQEMLPKTPAEGQEKDAEKKTEDGNSKEKENSGEEKAPDDDVQKQIELLQQQLDNLKHKKGAEAETEPTPEKETEEESAVAAIIGLPGEEKPKQTQQPQQTNQQQTAQQTAQQTSQQQQSPYGFGMGGYLGDQLGSALGGKTQTDLSSAFSAMLNGQPPQQQQQQPVQQAAPAPPPMIQGKAYVVNGDTLKINGRRVRLFGIDAPDPSQKCAARTGASYDCGSVATRELKKMIGNSALKCKIREQDAQGNVIAACSNGKYDMGVAMVASGWAVAYRQFSGFYVPYEEKAKAQRRGLWAGNFYMPWDWRRNEQIRRKKMQTQRRKSGGGGILGGMLD